jgi:hypothetical protein
VNPPRGPSRRPLAPLTTEQRTALLEWAKASLARREHAVLIALLLFDHGREEGAHPGLERLRSFTGYSASSVANALSQLVRAGVAACRRRGTTYRAYYPVPLDLHQTFARRPDLTPGGEESELRPGGEVRAVEANAGTSPMTSPPGVGVSSKASRTTPSFGSPAAETEDGDSSLMRLAKRFRRDAA